jgi:hypothetical protein
MSKTQLKLNKDLQLKSTAESGCYMLHQPACRQAGEAEKRNIAGNKKIKQ